MKLNHNATCSEFEANILKTTHPSHGSKTHTMELHIVMIYRHTPKIVRSRLVLLASRRHIKHSRVKKNELIDMIRYCDAKRIIGMYVFRRTRVRAACCIQRWWIHSSRVLPKNNVDPITLETLRRPYFTIVSPDGKGVWGYDPLALRTYIETSMSLTDPVTRRQWNAVELGRLSRATPGGVICIHPEVRGELDNQANLAIALERQLEGCVESIIRFLEDCATINVLSQIISFEDFIADLHSSVDNYKMISHWGCGVALDNCIRRALLCPHASHLLNFVVEVLIQLRSTCVVPL